MSRTAAQQPSAKSKLKAAIHDFMLTELKALPRLAPLKKTELPKMYYGEGASPFDVALKPCGTLRERNPSIKAIPNKTVIEYLYDLPAHMDAFREVLAFNLLLIPDEAQRFTLGVEDRQPGQKLSPQGIRAIVAQLRTKPRIFLEYAGIGAVNKNGQMHGDLKLDVRDHFHFDFDQYKTRLEQFRTALRERDVPGIREGIQLLHDIKKLYSDVPKRLYAMDKGDNIAINSVDELYAPFRNVLGAIAFKLRNSLKAALTNNDRSDSKAI